MEVWGILLAAGDGARFGVRKQFVSVHGMRLVDRVATVMAAACDHVVLVVPPDVAWGGPPVTKVVCGGRTRAASVREGLDAIPASANVIVVHDAAHPMAGVDLFARVVGAVNAGADASAPALRLDEPLKHIRDDDIVAGTVPRDDVRLIQTPHAFRADALRSVHRARPEALEDTTLIESAGGVIRLVPGDPGNIHVTEPRHLEIVAALAPKRWR